MKVGTSILSKLFFSVMAITIIASSCSPDQFAEEKNIFNLSGNATAAKEKQTPAVNSPAKGTITGTFDRNSRILTYNVTWTGLTDSAVAAHFHGPADSTQNAGVLIPLNITSAGPTGSASGSVTLSDTLTGYFLNDQIYYNVHTKKYPAGEIRSQVHLQ